MSADYATRSHRPSRIFALAAITVFDILLKVILILLCVSITSEGLRFLVPSFGQRLSAQPFLGFLREYEGAHRLDLAHIFAVPIAILVFFLWKWLLRTLIEPGFVLSVYGFDPIVVKTILSIMCIVVLGLDALCFYCAIANMGWQGTTFSFPALLGTALYAAVIVGVSFMSLLMHKSVTSTR